MLTLLELSSFLSPLVVSTPTPSAFQVFHIRLQALSPNPLHSRRTHHLYQPKVPTLEFVLVRVVI